MQAFSRPLIAALMCPAICLGFAEKKRGGPAPYGYYRILGDSDPHWSPAKYLHRGAGTRLDWMFLGARPITGEAWSGYANASGRVSAIATHPTDPNTTYIGGASGGVWKTTDGGANWTPLTDHLPSLNSGALAIDPNNPDTVYYGTGEWPTGATGDGLYRSTDGGATWERIGTTAQVGSLISRIALHPTDPLTIHVAGNIGHVRTTNGGASWSSPLIANLSDIAINPTTPTTLFAGRYGHGVYRSTNGGASWTKLNGGLPLGGGTRVNISLCRSNPLVVYAALLNNSGGLYGLFRTSDGGTTWTQLGATPNYPYPQGWYDHFVACDPDDPDTVYCGGVFPSYAVAGVIKTTDGGATWDDITVGDGGGQLHPDQHIAVFGPDGTVWVGNDGGVWKSVDAGFSWTNCNATLGLTQNYNIALHPTDGAQMLGGTQDNGNHRRTVDQLAWPQVLAGDGGFCVYDHDQPTRFFVTYIYLDIYRFVNNSYNNYISGPWVGVDPAGFIAPLVGDPNSPTTLLGGTNRVWRTTNARASIANLVWTAISDSTVGGGSVLTAIAVATGAPNTIYSGSGNGRVFVTTDAATWADRSPGGASTVSDIVIDPADWQHAYVCLSASTGSRVWETVNAGLNWTSATGDLPVGVSGRALAIDWRTMPPRLFLGSGAGVFASYDGGTSWIKESVNLPNVNIGDLAIHMPSQTLTAGTYGRGAWRTPLPCLPGDLDQSNDVDPADVPLFVDVLLFDAGSSEETCAADVNEDGAVNGDDAQPFIDLAAGGP